MDPFEILSLATIKAHLRLDPASTSEDALLYLFAGSAAENASAFTGIDFSTIYEIPFSIKAAMLLIIGDLWENREAQQPVQLHQNQIVTRLLQSYRDFS